MAPIAHFQLASAIALIAMAACGPNAGEEHKDAPVSIEGQPTLRLEQLIARPIEIVTSNGATPAAVDKRGTVYMVDRDARRVESFSSALLSTKKAGRRGAGPGEYSEPVSIGILSNGHLVVLDRSLLRLQFLQWPTDTFPPTVVRTVSLRGGGESMCVGPNDELILLGMEAGNRIRVLDTAGRLVRGIAKQREAESVMAATMTAKGLLACDVNHDRLVVAYRFSPLVETFRLSNGDLLSADTLAPFRPLKLTDRGKSVSISSGPAGYSEPVSILLGDSLLVIQTSFVSRTDKGEDTVVTYSKPYTGNGWMVQADLPILTQLGKNSALAIAGDSATEARVYRTAF